MIELAELRKQISEVPFVQMKADGFCLWLVWAGECNPILIQTLEGYGGVLCAGAEGQSLWFFFTPDVFLAAARLAVWARFNALSVGMRIFSGRLQVGSVKQRMLIFDEAFWQQACDFPDAFRVYVHSTAFASASGIPGVALQDFPAVTGMPGGEWKLLEVDPRLPYPSSFSWYAILHPVGSSLDKAFQAGWREFFGQIESLLRRNKFRFTLSDYYLMFHLDSLVQFKTWCRDYLHLVNRVKHEFPEQYWPCVQVIVDRRGLSFNDELPSKVGLDWDQLSPDFPCMLMRDALILGNEFSYHQVRFALSKQSADDWCCITLQKDEDAVAGGFPPLLPASLVLGTHRHCFYCGQRAHETESCPSRLMPPYDDRVWQEMAILDFSAMQQAVAVIDQRLGADPPDDVLVLAAESSNVGVMTRAFFDLNWPAQLRSVSTMWRMRGKDMSKALHEPLPGEDDSPLWAHLHAFPGRELPELERDLQILAYRFPKDFRVPSLRGFVALERADYPKAMQLWKEAELLSPYPVIQSWHLFLQARLLEYQSLLPQALLEYANCLQMTPAWHFLGYRRLVCEVKRGFSEHILKMIEEIIQKNANYFNKIVIDPELERGSIPIFTCLHNLWAQAESNVKEEETILVRMQDELANWFMPGNVFAQSVAQRAQKLLDIKQYNNYVAYQSLILGRRRLEQEMQQYIKKTGREYKNQFALFVDRLRFIHDEAAWFPFPRLLVEFNRAYNLSVSNLNWAMRNSFQTPDAYKKAQRLIDEEGERLKKLEGRMRFLRIIRDATLFILAFAETFFWIEAVGIVCIFVILPLILVYGDTLGLALATSYISKQQWQVQKGIFFLISLLALGIAGLRTVLSFERIREKIFAKAKAMNKKDLALKKKSSAKK